MLYSASVSNLKKKKEQMKVYYLMRKPMYARGNEAVIPDQANIDQYQSGAISWIGFKLNYLEKLMRPEADEWIRSIAMEAVNTDVVLVSDEENSERCFRFLLAERIMNMYSGQINLRYAGELE